MTLTRRRFLRQATPLGLVPFLPGCMGDDAGGREACCEEEAEYEPFLHGVASGDPLSDAVILWTKVTARSGAGAAAGAPSASEAEIEVEWRMAADPAMSVIVARGAATTSPKVDHTVKVDATGLRPDTTYYYDFAVLGSRSPVGRTRTLPSGATSHVRLAVVSCANYPAGYFNAYRLIAERTDLDLVLHLGDYLYEYPNGTLGDGAALRRMPNPDRETVTLEDYRLRHAQYKLDADLQELHRQHPLIAIWDDHEVANNAFRDGAPDHQSDSEGEWALRKANALRAYFEWMPVRPADTGDVERIYRAFAWGDLLDLVMLDTRLAGRDERVSGNCDVAGIEDPERSLLGAEQETWLFAELRRSRERGARWRVIGQQVMFGQLSDVAEGCISHPDQWDGYAGSRARVLDVLREESIDNVIILTGDAHSSWALDITDNPFDSASYDGVTGEGSRAVEFVAPAVSSPATNRPVDDLLATHPHLKFANLTRRGYMLLDLTPERAQAEWYFVATVDQPSVEEELGAAFRTLYGENRLRPVSAPSAPRAGAPLPAP